MGESTPSGAPNDTIKLVTPEGDKDELAVQDEPKPEADSVTEPILLPPSDTTSPADLGGDSRELSVSSDGSLASDKTELCKTQKRPGISGVKWAEEPAEVKSCETFPVESPKDEDHEKTVPSPECTGSDISDSMSQPLCHEEGLSSKTPIWLPLQEETKQLEDGENKTPNMSSADTDEGDTDSAPTKVSRIAQDKHDRTQRFPRTSPALRKDSIDVYKKRKQGQYPGAPRLLLNLDGQKSAAEEEKPESEAGANGTTGAPPGATDLPSPSILKRRSSILKIDKEVRQGVFTVLSGMYAMFLTILGAVLPVAEVFADQKHPLLFEVFYIYMYGGSILFLGYVYTYLLRTRATQKPEPQPQHKKKRRKRRVSVDKVSSHTGSFYLRLGAVAFGIGSMIHSGLQFGDYFEVEASDPCGHAVFAFRPMVHLIFTFVQLYFVFMNSKMCINRYKVIARFGLMHMVATNMCVWFNTIVEETLHQFKLHETDVDHMPVGANPLHSHPRLQTNHTLLADSRRNVSSLGRGHGARDVHETAAPLLTTTLGHILGVHTHHHNVTHAGDAALSVPLMTVTPPPAATCHTSQLMMTVLETVGPYLYPCTIEYSLICAGIIYTLWKNIGKRVMSIKCDDDSDEPAQAQRLRVDCSNSSRGLFVGILILVGTIITVVVFFVLVKTPSFNQSAMLVEYLSEILLFAVSSVAVIIAALRMRYLRFNSARDTDFEEVLILISLAGDYMFQMLSLVAAIFDRELFASRLSITACLLGIGQSTLQTMFVLDALRRSSRTTEQGTKKQGRELVTFLLISNIALWCINTFEAERTVANPVQMHYYGALAWNILTHISIPLGIFFRFHSTVCLSNIWKRAWKSYP